MFVVMSYHGGSLDRRHTFLFRSLLLVVVWWVLVATGKRLSYFPVHCHLFLQTRVKTSESLLRRRCVPQAEIRPRTRRKRKTDQNFGLNAERWLVVL